MNGLYKMTTFAEKGAPSLKTIPICLHVRERERKKLEDGKLNVRSTDASQNTTGVIKSMNVK